MVFMSKIYKLKNPFFFPNKKIKKLNERFTYDIWTSFRKKIILLFLRICNEYDPFSQFRPIISFPNCVSLERNFQFLFFEFYLVIPEGTFLDGMITIGMFLKGENSYKMREEKIQKKKII